MIQDILTNLIVYTVISVFSWAIADITFRLVNDLFPQKLAINPPKPQDYREAFSDRFNPQVEKLEEDSIGETIVKIASLTCEKEIDRVHESQKQQEKATINSSKKSKQVKTKVSKAINVAKLNLTHARVACRVLGIQQKVNGHDANLAWMQAQINGILQEKPQLTSQVYEAIKAKYPDLAIPDLDSPQAFIA
jgi:hypothetical protein